MLRETPRCLERGRALFNARLFWEAHEAWERLWHAHGRRGPTADLLKALIKLAAAGARAQAHGGRGVLERDRGRPAP